MSGGNGGTSAIDTSAASSLAGDLRNVAEGLPSAPPLPHLPGDGAQVVGALADVGSGLVAVCETLGATSTAAADHLGQVVTDAIVADHPGLVP